MCVCYLQLVDGVFVLLAPGLLPLPHALLQANQHALLTALQLAHARALPVTRALQVSDLHEERETQAGRPGQQSIESSHRGSERERGGKEKDKKMLKRQNVRMKGNIPTRD